MRNLAVLLALTWSGLWFTPDQQGRRHFERQEYREAAAAFHDPMWQGAAWYRAGEFEKAAQAFARSDSPEALFNQANAWLMRGKYETAVDRYDKALAVRPDWKEAIENRALADARSRLVEQKGGDLGDQKLGADQIVFDKDKGSQDGQNTTVDASRTADQRSMQEMWLRRVTTKPADFLRVKFAYQAQIGEEEPVPNDQSGTKKGGAE